jgi:hypothetical protein
MPREASEGEMLDPRTGTVKADSAGRPDKSFDPVYRLAERIARNREVLGMHYPSNSAAGRKLAEDAFPLPMQCKSVKVITQRVEAEW